jgi:hypothetical protein
MSSFLALGSVQTMNTRILLTAAFGATLLLWLAGRVAAVLAPEKDKPSDDDAAKAQQVVNDDLNHLKAAGFTMQQVKDEAVQRSFPKYHFFGVFFRQFPVARLTPEGLNSANLYAVGPDAKPQLLKEPKQLEDFFKTNLSPAKTDDAAKDAARAYVRLAEELHQDGFFKFALQDDSTKIGEGKDGQTATARAVVMAGGNGELGARLTFDDAGKLTKIVENIKIKEGPRPICQAMKLLDADAIVRRMAERDLVIMGRAAKPYLDEQRAKAPPELQRAIDHIWRQIFEEDR